MKPVIEFQCVDGEAKPMYACGHCRMLGRAIDRNNDRQAAERCCLCENCGAAPRERGRVLCAECDRARREQHESELRKRLNALPEVDYTGGPVYWDDEYYSDLETALDVMSEDDLASAIIHPCDEDVATLPDVVSYIEERLAEQFDTPDGPYLSENDEKVLSDVMRLLSPPRVWIVRDTVRLSRSSRSWLNAAQEGADA